MDVLLFNNYWKKLSDSIESLLIRRMSKSTLELNSINREIKAFTNKWKWEKYPEGAWIKELMQEDIDKGDKVLKAISEFSFKSVPVAIPSMIKYYAIAIGIGIASIVIVLTLSLSFWKSIFIPILCFIFSFGFLVPQGKGKVDEAKKKAIGQYMKQVSEVKQTIDHILSN